MTDSPRPPVPLDPPPDELRRMLDRCAEFVVGHLASLGDLPASDLDGAAELAASFREPAPEEGRSLEAILERLGPAVTKSFNTAGPGYLAYIPGGGIPAAAMADLIACAVNRYVGVAAAAPALAAIEATVVRWLAGMMGYPETAGGVLTSGGSLSNLTAVYTARAARLGEPFLDGVIYLSEEAHHSLGKAARLAGLPEANVRAVGVDRRLRMRPESLAAAIDADRAAARRPFLLIASSGSTNTGAVDPLPDLLPVARRHGLWVHADAAYGGFFRIVPGGERLLPGLEECDSITLDPHKGLFLPYGTGCLLVRDLDALRRAHRAGAAYLQDLAAQEDEDFADLSPELSRDFRGLRVWLPLMLHGVAAFRAALREKLELARWAHEELKDDPNVEILDEPQLSVLAFRFRDGHGDADALGAELLRRVNARRRVFLSSTSIGGRFVLRICILSFRTHLDRVREAVAAIREEAAHLARGAPGSRIGPA
jgi:aromatic-L-amino-acid decarboxylase